LVETALSQHPTDFSLTANTLVTLVAFSPPTSIANAKEGVGAQELVSLTEDISILFVSLFDFLHGWVWTASLLRVVWPLHKQLFKQSSEIEREN